MKDVKIRKFDNGLTFITIGVEPNKYSVIVLYNDKLLYCKHQLTGEESSKAASFVKKLSVEFVEEIGELFVVGVKNITDMYHIHVCFKGGSSFRIPAVDNSIKEVLDYIKEHKEDDFIHLKRYFDDTYSGMRWSIIL